jgi:ATP-dependent DNA ligase
LRVPERFGSHQFKSLVVCKPEAIGIKATLPGFIEPALASAIERVPSGDRWIHEIKFDGYRVQVHLATRRSRSSPGAAMTVTLPPSFIRPVSSFLAVGLPCWAGEAAGAGAEPSA